MSILMEVIDSIEAFPARASVLTMGNFDGLHRGHSALLDKVIGRAGELSVSSALLTFSPHPLKLFKKIEIKEIFTQREMQHSFSKTDLEYLVIHKFNKEFSQMSPKAFLDLVFESFQPREIVVGYDFRFGHQGEGDYNFLKSYCETSGVTLSVVGVVEENSIPISSTRIRKNLGEGELVLANRLLGYPYFVIGKVVSGLQKGQQLGFPTLNLKPTYDFMLPSGVYKTQTTIDSKVYPSITNVGFAPTVRKEGKLKTIETHIYDQNICDVSELKLEFLAFVRKEKKFAHIDELVEQITKDIASVKKMGI